MSTDKYSVEMMPYGAEVVAAKRIKKGGSIHKPPNRDWQKYFYVICGSCQRFLFSMQEFSSKVSYDNFVISRIEATPLPFQYRAACRVA